MAAGEPGPSPARSAISDPRRIRVAVDMTFPNRNRGGTGAAARALVGALERVPEIDLRPVATSRGLPVTLRWLARGARSRIREERAELLHCPAFVVPWRCGVPYVVSILDTSTELFPEDHPLEWRFYARHLMPERARRAAHVITMSGHTRKAVVAAWGLAPERVSVVPGGVGEEFRTPEGPPRPVDPRPRILFCGSPVRRKNLDLLLAALAAASPETVLGRSRLLISGASASGHPLQAAAIDRLGLGRRVEWLGQVADMPALYRSVDVLAYPSWYEGFGLPPLEAMASGTPVVCSDTSSLPEVVGDAAMTVSPDDSGALAAALAAVLEREEVRARLVAAGRRRAAGFTWEAAARMTVDVYRRALAAGG